MYKNSRKEYMWMDNKLKLYIVRHGQTEWNVLEKFQGQLNSPLTLEGIKKIKETSAELEDIKFEAVYTSELGRTISTADIILQHNNFEKIKNPLKIDITTGDVIIPSEIEYSYETIFKEKLNILVYSLETLIAEKYETIIKRNITTTRLRDFYDIYMIFKLKNDKIDVNNLKQSIWETAKNRNSMEEILESKEILEDIKNDEYLNKQWNIYKKENKYVDNIQFSEILELLNKISDIIQVDLL